MYCPECGHDAAEAKFCPECGNDLTAVRSPPGRGRLARPVPAAPARTQRPRTARRAAERRGEPVQTGRPRSVLWIWLGFAAAAVVLVVIIVALGGRSSGGSAAPAAGPVTADTSGGYSVLVARANGLYDQGIAAFNKKDNAGGIAAFKAAAEVYGAAWKKQPGDPNVGTDYAVALFYSGQTDRALRQIDVVISKSPDFQTAYLNKGIFLKTAASDAKASGEAKKGADLLSRAKLTFQKAVSMDPASDAGKKAAAQLQGL